LSNTAVEKISPISNLKSLEELKLNRTKVLDLDSLMNAANLKMLYLGPRGWSGAAELEKKVGLKIR
jgi:Leucine-rich repeat (LRR) protein